MICPSVLELSGFLSAVRAAKAGSHPDGRIEQLTGPGTPPLGILNGVEYREHEVAIPAGSLLLMYTDGLIERRDTTLSRELDRLMGLVSDAPDDPRACLDWLEESLGADEVPDDIAMVAMSVPSA